MQNCYTKETIIEVTPRDSLITKRAGLRTHKMNTKFCLITFPYIKHSGLLSKLACIPLRGQYRVKYLTEPISRLTQNLVLSTFF